MSFLVPLVVGVHLFFLRPQAGLKLVSLLPKPPKCWDYSVSYHTWLSLNISAISFWSFLLTTKTLVLSSVVLTIFYPFLGTSQPISVLIFICFDYPLLQQTT
jgi:hypothetical protein